ncbi:MAG: MarR family winged helix-turn-helix transcriptional regulator [Halioglobus sp.]
MPKVKKSELGQTLMLALKNFQQRLDAELAKRGFPGIRQRHRAVFIHLNVHGASRSVELAAAAGIRPQSMMKIVHELEELGLVTREEDPADSRAKLIQFTAAGRALIDQLTQTTELVWDQYCALLGEAELDRTLSALRLLQEATFDGGRT